jgi:acetyl-CoA acyltransferase
MVDAVIVDAVRTPLGRGRTGGALSKVHPADLLAHTLRAVIERTGVNAGDVDDVIGGCVSQVGEQTFNVTRSAALAAGFPETVPATTVDRQCGSSQQAIHFAAHGVVAGAYDTVIACGVESMSRVPMGSAMVGADPFGPGVHARYADRLVPQGIAAEMIAAQWSLSREQQDELALRSHQRAAAAASAGRFEREIVPVKAALDDGVMEVAADEGIRPDASYERMAQLPPAFYSQEWDERHPGLGWGVTAANSSQITDGAAAVMVMSSDRADELGLRPRARLHSFAVVGDDPILMLTGVVPATLRALERGGLKFGDIDLFEVNEAFASVVLAWQWETGADPDRVNVNGGAIALGHPLGASGARLTATLVNALEQHDGQWGLQVMCEAGGLSNAMIIERL